MGDLRKYKLLRCPFCGKETYIKKDTKEETLI